MILVLKRLQVVLVNVLKLSSNLNYNLGSSAHPGPDAGHCPKTWFLRMMLNRFSKPPDSNENRLGSAPEEAHECDFYKERKEAKEKYRWDIHLVKGGGPFWKAVTPAGRTQPSKFFNSKRARGLPPFLSMNTTD